MIGLIDSGRGLLPTAAMLRRTRPDVDVILANDPVGAPWGPKTPEWVTERVLDLVDECLASGAQGIVLPCNTASVVALQTVRDHVAGRVPVIGTVPAIKPAAAQCQRFAVWATAATTASAYQANLIETFAVDRDVFSIACHGLAESIDREDSEAIDAALDQAVGATPSDVEGIVLGCTHYPLIQERITARLPGVSIYDSSRAVAAQALRRIEPSVGTARALLLAHAPGVPMADLESQLDALVVGTARSAF